MTRDEMRSRLASAIPELDDDELRTLLAVVEHLCAPRSRRLPVTARTVARALERCAPIVTEAERRVRR